MVSQETHAFSGFSIALTVLISNFEDKLNNNAGHYNIIIPYTYIIIIVIIMSLEIEMSHQATYHSNE